MANRFEKYVQPATSQTNNRFSKYLSSELPQPAQPESGGDGIFSALAGGTKATFGALRNTLNLYTGDSADILDEATSAVQRTPAQDAFAAEIKRRSAEGDQGWMDAIQSVVGAAWQQPVGALHEIAAQLPNMGVALGGFAAGAKTGFAIGSVINPGVGSAIGTVTGGILGMFAGNTALESGFRASELAQDGQLTQEEMSQARTQGAIKGGVITAVDVATLGLSRAFAGAPGRAVENAVTSVLRNRGVDVASETATKAALRTPEILAEVVTAGAGALARTMTKAQKLARGGIQFTLESAGEGGGEYLGSVAAGLEASPADAVLEALMSIPMSVAEMGIAGSKIEKGANTKLAEGQLGREISIRDTVNRIAGAPTVDAAIREAARMTGANPADMPVPFDLTPFTPEPPEARIPGIEIPSATATLDELAAMQDPNLRIPTLTDKLEIPTLTDRVDIPTLTDQLTPEEVEAAKSGRLVSMPTTGESTTSLLDMQPQSQPGSEIPAAGAPESELSLVPTFRKNKLQEAMGGAEREQLVARIQKSIRDIKQEIGSLEIRDPSGERIGKLRADLSTLQNRLVEAQLSPETGSQREQLVAQIDQAAHQAATSPQNDLPQPTEAQKQAGNYAKGHVRLQGLDITIENPNGSMRSGTDPDGKAWQVSMQHHYGYIRRTEGADGEQVDTFIGPAPDSQQVFVVDQLKADGSFDEHKALIGFDSQDAAIEGYRSNYDKNWKVGPVTAMTMPEFKAWLAQGKNTDPVNAAHFAGGTPQPAAEVVTNITSEDADRGGLPQVDEVPVESVTDDNYRQGIDALEAQFRAHIDAGELEKAVAVGREARKKQVDAVQAMLDAGEGPALQHGNIVSVITKSTRNAGKLQVTRFDESGALGHSDISSPEDLASLGLSAYAKILSKEEADAFMGKVAAAEASRGEAQQPQQQPDTKQFSTADFAPMAAQSSSLTDFRKRFKEKFGKEAANNQDGNIKAFWSAEKRKRGKMMRDDDSILVAVAKLGGINVSWMEDITGDTRNKLIPGVGPVFRKDGTSPDDMAVMLIEAGYIAPENYNDVASDRPVRDLYRLMGDEFAGKKRYQLDSNKALDEALAARQDEYEQMLDQAKRDEEEMYAEIEAEFGKEAADLARWYDKEMESYIGSFDEAIELAGDFGLTNENEAQNEEREARANAAAADTAEDRQQEGPAPAEAGGGQRGAPAPAPGAEGFQLDQQTPEEIAKQEQTRLAEEKARREAEAKERADADRGSFVLSGSKSAVDQAEARGQNNLFGANPPRLEPSDTADLPKGWTGSGTGLISNSDPQSGGIIDKRVIGGRWFVIPNRAGIEIPEDFETREQALAALQDALDVADKPTDNAFESEAPEHAVVGVDNRELSEVVDAFNNAQRQQDADQAHHLFDQPSAEDVVRLGQKAGIKESIIGGKKVYHREAGWLTIEQAKEMVTQWKQRAAEQGDTNANSTKVVLSLFDLTGSWSQPWEDAGYQVFRFDIQSDPIAGDVNNFSGEFFNDWFGDFDGMDVYAILAACPCTDFAVSGAKHFAAKDADGRTVASVKLVHQTLAAIEHFKPAVWAIENPVGRIEQLGGLPPWRLSFDPYQLGEPYTKRTLLWGRFNADLPIAPVEPTEGSKMHKKYGGKSLATKNARSETPEGFSYAFFMANNAIDNPVMAIANKYDRLDRNTIKNAVDAGITASQIDAAVEDLYYMDLDDTAANNAIQDLIDKAAAKKAQPPKAPKKKPADKPKKAPTQQERPKEWGSNNKLVTKDRADELRAKLRAKLDGRASAGIDPEILAMGAELAAFHIEAGARKFADFARAIAADLGMSVADLKQYLRGWYNGARDMMEDSGNDIADMDSAENVRGELEKVIALEEQSNADDQPDGEDLQDGTDAEQDAGGDLFGEVAGGGGQSAGSAGGRAGGQGSRTGGRVSGGRTTSGGKRGNQQAGEQGAETESGAAGSADGRGGAGGSAGGLFADRESDGAIEGSIEKAAAVEGKELVPIEGELIRANKKQIKKQMPFLTDGQVDDVVFAETRFAVPDGYGVLFTNGTGTGKTFTGLGIMRRMFDAGKKNILVVAPKQTIVDAWVRAAEKFFGLKIKVLESTQDNGGKGIVATTYANFGGNDSLARRGDWDLIVLDEAHYLSQDAEGSTTIALEALRALALQEPNALARLKNPELVSEIYKLAATIDLYSKSDSQQWWDAAAELEPKLQRLRQSLTDKQEAEKARIEKIAPKDRPRALMLSATPFAYDKSVALGQGFLFDWNEGYSESSSYNAGSAFDRFMMLHFGYRMRYNKLTKPEGKVDSGLMERNFNAWLKKKGALSGRALDSDFDYDRRFVLAHSSLGANIDEALAWLRNEGQHIPDADKAGLQALLDLNDIINNKDNFGYHARMYLLEAIKGELAIPYIKAHLDRGRKVVVMHDFKKGGTGNPFFVSQLLQRPYADERIGRLYQEFAKKFPDLYNMKPMPSPIDGIRKAFPDALIYNGNFTAKQRIQMQNLFNDDSDGSPRIIIAQGDAMREGVSIHDTTGKFERVLVHLGLPVKPTASIQQEGRINRTGQASDALFRYFSIGTNWERRAFATTIAGRASTAENLAMGEQARGLKQAIIDAYEAADSYPPGHDGEGKGGKEIDAANAAILTMWDQAKSLYYSSKKQGKGRRAAGREGEDYFATPEPIGLKMVELADVRPGDMALEPSAGHGAIARWFPETVTLRAIEPSSELISQLSLRVTGDLVQSTFEEHNVVNKYDAIVMNPPFGSGGKTAIDHLAKAARHLKAGGRIVALIPTGPAADAKFDKWFYEESERPIKPLITHPVLGPIYKGDTLSGNTGDPLVVVSVQPSGFFYGKREGIRGEVFEKLDLMTKVQKTGARTEKYHAAKDLQLVKTIKLPSVTFERAGTGVMTRIVVIEKVQDGQQHAASNLDISSAETIGELFDRIENISIPARFVAKEDTAPGNISVELKRSEQSPATPAAPGAKFDTWEAKDSRDGSPIYMAKSSTKVDDFAALSRIAKSNGGYWSRFAKGFLFKTADARDEFVNQASGGNSVSEAGVIYEPEADAVQGRKAGYRGSQSDQQPDIFAPENIPTQQVVEQAKDILYAFNESVAVGSVSVAFDVIDDAGKAAHVMAPFRKNSQETMLALVLDENRRPIEIVQHTIGTKNSSTVNTLELVGAIVSAPGARHVWFGHNHPSGSLEASDADERITAKLTPLFSGTNVGVDGHVVLGGAKYTLLNKAGDTVETGRPITPGVRDKAVNVTQRRIRRRSSEQKINSSVQANALIKNLSSENAIILLDTPLRVVGVMTLSAEEMSKLRAGNRAGRILKAIHSANARSVIIKSSDESAGNNVAAFLGWFSPDMDVLDIFVKKGDTYESAADNGRVPRKGAFASQDAPQFKGWLTAETGTAGMTVPEVLDAIAGPMKKLKQRLGIDVVVVKSTADAGLDPGKRYAGAYVNGKVYLFADNLQGARKAQVTLAHELVGHKGLLEALSNEELAEVRRLVDNLVKLRNETALDIMAEVNRRYPGVDADTAFKEFIALAAERREKRGSFGTIMATLKAALRRLLKSMGFDTAFAESELEIILQNSEAYLKKAAATSAADAAMASASAPTFYSALLDTIIRNTSSPRKGNADQWKAWLDGRQRAGDFKKSERDWIGVDEWLAGRGQTTREELQQFVSDNQVQVQEVMFGDQEPADITAKRFGDLTGAQQRRVPGYEGASDDDFVVYRNRVPMQISDAPDEETAIQWASDIMDEADIEKTGRTKYGDRVVPGGENYKELLLTLPPVTNPPLDNGKSPATMLFENTMLEKYGTLTDTFASIYNKLSPAEVDKYEMYVREDRNTAKSAAMKRDRENNFKSSHFDQPNILAHVRFNERVVNGDLSPQQQADLEKIQAAQPELQELERQIAKVSRGSAIQRDIAIEERKQRLRGEVRAGRMTIGEMNAELDAINVPNAELASLNERYRKLRESLPKMPKRSVERILFVEEIQSDWHQAGRKSGYRRRVQQQRVPVVTGKAMTLAEFFAEQEMPEAEAKKYLEKRNATRADIGLKPMGRDSAVNVIYDDGAVVMVIGADSGRKLDTIVQKRQLRHEENAQADRERYEQKTKDSVPDAPFKATDEWAMLAFKRMVRYAAENGFDRIAWTTGEQQADRYDLSKQVDEVVAYKDGDLYTITVLKDRPGGRGLSDVLFQEENVAIERVRELVGKELADKIANQPRFTGTYRDIDLKVGGEGMRGFYDKILPYAVNKWAKKLGAKVDFMTIDTGRDASKKKGLDRVTKAALRELAFDARSYDRDEFNDRYEEFTGLRLQDAQIEDLQDLVADPSHRTMAANRLIQYADESMKAEAAGANKQPYVAITPAMREAALQGLPLFSKPGATINGADEARRNFMKGMAAAAVLAGATTVAGTDRGSVSLGRASAITGAREKIPDQALRLLPQPSQNTEIVSWQQLADAVRAIAEHGPESMRALAGKIAGLLPHSGYIFVQVDDSSDANAHGMVRKAPLMLTLFTKGERQGLSVGTVLHEILHLAVLARYDNLNAGTIINNYAKLKLQSPNASSALQQFVGIFEEFRKTIDSLDATTKELYMAQVGLSEAYNNPDEFFVRSLTDADFQALIAQIPYEGKTLLDRFVGWIKESLFGWRREGVQASWLDAALLGSEELLDAMKSDPADFGMAKALAEYFDSRQELYSRVVSGATARRGAAPLFSRGAAEESDYSAENRAIREEDKTLWDRIKQEARRQLTPAGLLPDSVFHAKIARDSKLQVIEFDIAHLVGELERAIRKDYSVRADQLSDTDMATLADALTGKMPESLGDETRKAVIAMRQYIDSQSQQYIDILREQAADLMADMNAAEQALTNAYIEAGEIEPASGSRADRMAAARQRDAIIEAAKEAALEELGTAKRVDAAARKAAAVAEKVRLIRVITGNVGTYAHRSYQAFDDPNWFRKVPDRVLDDARDYLMGRMLDNDPEMAEEDARERARVLIEDILKEGTAYDSMESFIKESKLGAKDLSVLIRRKQIAPEIRALLGEYRDPRINFAKSATKMGRLIWNQRFLDRVLEVGRGVFLFNEDDRPANTTQIAATGSEVYAPLNGLYAPREIVQAFKDALGKEQLAGMYKWMVQANGAIKFGKTVLSPTTTLRNWQSAMLFTLANGHFDLTQIRKSVDGLREYFTHSGQGAKLAYLRKLKDLGVVYDAAYAGEMMKLLDDFQSDTMIGFGPDSFLRKSVEFAKKAYSYGDDFWKIVGFENEKNLLMKAGMDEAAAEKEAAERIRNTYPTYSMVGMGIQKLRRFPLVGTFVSFPAEIIRTTFNMLRYIAKDLKTPGMRPLALRRIAGLAIAAGFAHALQEMLKQMFDVDDDDEEAVRLQAAPWQQNSNLLFVGRDDAGNLRYFDISFLDPYNYWKRPINAMLRDQPWEDELVSAAKDMLTPFFGTDILAGTLMEVYANQKDTGGKVYQPAEPLQNQVMDIANHLRKDLQPGLMSNIERTWRAMDGQLNTQGQKYDIDDEILSWLGWRATTLDTKVALRFHAFDFKDAKSAASAALNQVLTDPNEVSSEQIVDAYELSMSMRDQAYEDMMKMVSAAERSGLTPQQVRMVLSANDVSQADIAAMMAGRIPAWTPSRASETSAIKEAIALLGPEKAREIRQRYVRARQEAIRRRAASGDRG